MKSELPEIGKISPEIFKQVIYPRLGRRRPEVLVGPQSGVDVGVVDIGGGKVLISTTDPVFVVPQYGFERAAWFAVHILASDAVTSGIAPSYITFDLNLPLAMTREELQLLWGTIHDECDKLGMAVVTGHTGRYQGCDYPMVGGATVICIGERDKYVTPTMAGPGDRVIVTKGAAIEAAGLFAVTFRDHLAKRYGEPFAREAEQIFWQMSVVEDALTAVQVGVRDDGVTTMHDATECGVWGGLFEVARASGVGMVIDEDKIICQPVVRRICETFGIDPYRSISEGTLILTCRPHKAHEILARLSDKGIPASEVGEVVPGDEVRVSVDGRERALEHPEVDPFWGAFGAAAAKLLGDAGAEAEAGEELVHRATGEPQAAIARAPRFFGLYVCVGDAPLDQVVVTAQKAIAGGAGVIQLRSKSAAGAELFETAQALLEVTRERGVTLLINDRVDIALAVDADGVHLGQSDLPAAEARRLLGPERLLGVSARTRQQAEAAERAGADYLGFGPVFEARGTKVDAGAPVGLAALERMCRQTSLPVVAIGGIERANIAGVMAAGARGAAVISAVVGQPDEEEAARVLARACRDLDPDL